jgi:peptidyl-prolyl cis-trans isomerase D
MLRSMRKNVKSLHWILWIVVGTFIASIFFIWGGAGHLGEGSRAKTVAVAAGMKISSDEYQQLLLQRIESMRRQFSGLNQNYIQQLNIPQQVLIYGRLADDMGLKVADGEIENWIKNYSGFQGKNGFIGRTEYLRLLQYNHIAPDKFEDEVRQDLMVKRFVGRVTAGVVVTDDEVWESYRKQNDSAKVEYLVCETSGIEVKDAPSDAQIRARFAGNAAGYKVPERRTGDYLFLKTDDAKKGIKVDDAEVRKYYNANLSQFEEPEAIRVGRIWLPFTAKDKDAVLAQARDVLQKAQSGADFAALARSFSKDDKAKDGGDWGLADWRSLPAKQAEAAAKLDRGKVSGIVEAEDGAAILKVTEKTPAVTKTLAEVSANIKNILEDQKARTVVFEKITKLEKLARKEKSLDLAAQKEGLKIASTGALKKGDPLGDFDSAGSMSGALFGLKEKEISGIVYAYTGAGLAQLRKVEAERPAKLEEVRAEVEKDIVDSLKKEGALDKLRDITARIKDDWNAEAGKYKAEYKIVEAHKHEQYLSLVGEKPEIDSLIFSLPLKKVSDPVPAENGYAVFRVLDRKEAARADFDKVKAAEKDNAVSQKKQNFLSSYIVRLLEEKKIEIRNDVYSTLVNDVLAKYKTE